MAHVQHTRRKATESPQDQVPPDRTASSIPEPPARPPTGFWHESGTDEDAADREPDARAETPTAERLARARLDSAAPTDADRVARRAFTVLMVGAMVLLALIIEPIASALALAAALAGVLWSLRQKLMRKLKCRRNTAAGILVFGVLLAVVAPIATLSAFAVREVSAGLTYVSETVRSEGVMGLIEKLPPSLRDPAHAAIARLPNEPGGNVDQAVERQVNAQSGRAAQAVGALVAATGSFVFQAAMMLIALFFLLAHGDRCVLWLDRVSPLKKGQTRELLADFKSVSYAVVVSTLVTAAVQALAALIGYYVARVPHPVFFGAATFFMAFVPAIGAAGVCLAASGLLLLTGHPYAAAFLAVWALGVVAIVDNLLKPYLIRGPMHLHTAIVFFSLIGGLLAFGAAGLLIGPLIVTLFLALLRMYRRDFQPNRRRRASGAS